MQKLLDDIRVEMETLKACIGRMEQRLDELQGKLAEPDSRTPAEADVQAPERAADVPEAEAPSSSIILGERIKPAADLRHAISLNDSFRFTRELFGGDAARMNRVFAKLSEAQSLEEAMALLCGEVEVDEDNEAATALIELLRKYFN